MVTKKEIFKQIEVQEQLPTLPSILTKILNLLTDPEISTKKVAEVISTDISISSKTLKLVNSAFYGMPKKIKTINQAIVILGFNTIKAAVFGTAIMGSFDYLKNKISFDYESFWIHSVGVGVAARVLAKHIGYKDPEEAFIGGIVHDIGKLVLSIYNNEGYFKVIEKINEYKDETISNIEKEIFNYDHSEIGFYLAENWNFPKNLSGIIKYHHNPDDASSEYDIDLISIVNIANTFVKILNIGDSGNIYIDNINENTWIKFNLDINKLDYIYSMIEEEYNLATVFLH